MKLIVGLGNPGEKYTKNRHNVGFMFVDFLVKELTGSRVNEFKFNKYLQSEIVLLDDSRYTLHVSRLALHDLLLVKPQTFMNHSGRAVSACVTRFALHVSHDLIVIHDDLDIPFGKFKIQTGTGPQLHNGIDSINANLKTHDYLRIRIGVDARPPENRINGEDYVLQDFTEEELMLLKKTTFPQIKLQVVHYL